MSGKKYEQRTIRISEDFVEYIEKFDNIIKKDAQMLDSIPEKNKKKILKNGLFNHAIRELIKNYVDIYYSE